MTTKRQRDFCQSARWITLMTLLGLASLLQTAFAIGVQVSASAEQVCGDEFSHTLTVEWIITDASEGIQVEITVTLPDGSTQTSAQTTPQGSVTLDLPLPGGGSVQVQVIAQQGNSSASGSATVSLSPCQEKAEKNDEVTHEDTNVVDPTAEVAPESTPCQAQTEIPLDSSTTTVTQAPTEPCEENEISDQTNPVDSTSFESRPFGKTLGFGPEFAVPEHDLTVTDIEVSQGVQNLDNEMPLVKHRTTIVRVYVKDLSGLGAGNVSAQLSGSSGNVEAGSNPEPTQLGTLMPMNPGRRITVQHDGGDRKNLNDSFWFLLPAEWISKSTLTLTAEVNFDQTIVELDHANNSRSVSVVLFQAKPFYLRPVPVHLHPLHTSTQGELIQQVDRNISFVYEWDTAGRWKIYNNLFRYHPISSWFVDPWKNVLHPKKHAQGTEFNFRDKGDYFDQDNVRLGCGAINTELENLRLQEASSLANARWHYVGLMHPDLKDEACFSGLAFRPGRISWVFMDGSDKRLPWNRALGTFGPNLGFPGGSTLAHEIAHNEDRQHVFCSGNEASGGSIDEDYPYPDDPSTKSSNECRLALTDRRGFYGLDVYYYLWDLPEPSVIDNRVDAFPVMGYKWPKWIDPYTYCALFNLYVDEFECNIQLDERRPVELTEVAKGPKGITGSALPTANVPSTNQLLVISGILDLSTGQGSIQETTLLPASNLLGQDPSQTNARLQALTEPGSTSEFSLEVQGFRGALFWEQPITVRDTDHDELRFVQFTEILPFPEDGVSVGLSHQSQPLDSRQRSSNAPLVQLLSPKGGEVLDQNDTIRWQALDADGDPLSFQVLLSIDGGISWRVLGFSEQTTEFNLSEVDGLPGTGQGKIRIVASDGFLTGQADSNGTFTILPSAPKVSISGIEPNQQIIVSDRVILIGLAEDTEDLVLNQDEAFAWFSSLNGYLGNGQRLVLEPHTLLEGTHEITLSVTDSDGMSAQASVSIEVAPEPQRDALDVQVGAEVDQACDAETNSRSMSVTWEVSGGQLPILVTMTVIGPDGTTAAIPNHPVKGIRPFQMSYLDGGPVTIELNAKDANGVSVTAEANVELSSCRAVN